MQNTPDQNPLAELKEPKPTPTHVIFCWGWMGLQFYNVVFHRMGAAILILLSTAAFELCQSELNSHQHPPYERLHVHTAMSLCFLGSQFT